VVSLASVAPPVIGYLLSPPLAIPLRFDVAARERQEDRLRRDAVEDGPPIVD